jgi:hypothetical protein
VRRLEDINEALWGTRVSPSAVSDLEDLRNDRGVPQLADRKRRRLLRRPRAQAQLGGRDPQRVGTSPRQCEPIRMLSTPAALNRCNDLNIIRRVDHRHGLYASHLLSGRLCPLNSGAISAADDQCSTSGQSRSLQKPQE